MWNPKVHYCFAGDLHWNLQFFFSPKTNCLAAEFKREQINRSESMDSGVCVLSTGSNQSSLSFRLHSLVN
jgi:hypothetical protein